jgi:hypothetical protein
LWYLKFCISKWYFFANKNERLHQNLEATNLLHRKLNWKKNSNYTSYQELCFYLKYHSRVFSPVFESNFHNWAWNLSNTSKKCLKSLKRSYERICWNYCRQKLSNKFKNGKNGFENFLKFLFLEFPSSRDRLFNISGNPDVKRFLNFVIGRFYLYVHSDAQITCIIFLIIHSVLWKFLFDGKSNACKSYAVVTLIIHDVW